MHPSSLQIKDFSYDLPDEKIARYPLSQRDQSRLLIYKNGELTEDVYQYIDKHLPEHALLVFNQTKVIHARLLFQKPTGGRIEVFCLEPDERYKEVQQAMLRQGEVFWKCLVGGAAKWKPGQVLQLSVNAGMQQLHMTAAVEERREGYFILKLNWNEDLTFAEALHIAGHVPLPPYLNREADQRDEERYQTMFAKEEGSVAAPTAALHFTAAIVDRLAAKNINTALLTLHVGAGTFKPVKSERMQDHDMHAEWIEADIALLQTVIGKLRANEPVIAVGTTSARTLESLYWIGLRIYNKHFDPADSIAVPQWYPYEGHNSISAIAAYEALWQYLQDNQLPRLVTRTQIIIAPGYVFKVISALVTNFHQPQSTLLLLVSALVGDAWRDIYNYALQQDFRFLSYGDGCLLWRWQQ